ncbi:hypothetical protein RB620_08870 [Paenibacillus sp. LHD-117]|uniref:hypothetical protein n=1 Tax=Paenibacillus sp. LHD-117 TaxID=3071412 RepID=UPI0027DFEC41|nr:hypothetical protein [Paenibacillus sp. LHD-117]MDQ6419542.1 hypothetical protein [Paenibacillus sp. LHD-117]
MVKRTLSKSIVLTFAFVIAMMAGMQAAYAAKETAVPLTAAPPNTPEEMAVYEGYAYLYASSAELTGNGNGTVRISVTTTAKTTVAVAGATVQLQRYTGTSWSNVGSSTTLTAANTSILTSYVDKTVTAGYYYRAKVTHYVTQGGTTESVVEYSASYLTS